MDDPRKTCDDEFYLKPVEFEVIMEKYLAKLRMHFPMWV